MRQKLQCRKKINKKKEKSRHRKMQKKTTMQLHFYYTQLHSCSNVRLFYLTLPNFETTPLSISCRSSVSDKKETLYRCFSTILTESIVKE